MDGGEVTVKKRFFFILISALLILQFSLCAFCADSQSPEYYEEYDNYAEFEQDYIDNHVAEQTVRSDFLSSRISVPAILIGAASGAVIAGLVLLRHLRAPQAQPYFRKPGAKSETVSENENLIG